MQIGDVGIGHDEHSHHITSSFHHHHETEKTKGATASAGASVSVSPKTPAVQQDGFSLSAWIADPFKTVKNLFGRAWNGGDAGNAARGIEGKALSGQEQLMAQTAEKLGADIVGKAGSGSAGEASGRQIPVSVQAAPSHDTQIAVAATAMPIPSRAVQDNPYFQAVADTESKRSPLVQKVKERVQTAAEFLAKRFSFSGKNSFQAKKEKPKEDLRKRSHYREDKLEIDCVLTDDSYLLDSYDRSGQYSQLSTKK